MLAGVKELETAMGRQAGERYGPRLIDIDILLYGQELVDLPGLQIPHPRLHERAFVLVPLAELAPNWQHVPLSRSIGQLAEAVDRSGIRVTDMRLRRMAADAVDWERGEGP